MGDQRHSPRRTTRRVAMCGVFCALAVVFLGMGALVEVMDLTAAIAASLVLLPILLCYGNRYALLSYAVTAVLGVLLMPQSLSAWMFAGLTGYYPIIKTRLDRLPRVLGWVIKLALLTAVLFDKWAKMPAAKDLVGLLDWEFAVEELPIEDTDPEPPKTGDDNQMFLWMALMAGSVTMLVLLVVFRRKKEDT